MRKVIIFNRKLISFLLKINIIIEQSSPILSPRLLQGTRTQRERTQMLILFLLAHLVLELLAEVGK